MNKFKKLLVLVLLLVVSVTVFTVVAFASEDEALVKHQALLALLDYETKNEGDLAEANPDGAGHFEIAVAENGNKYIKHHVSSGTGNASYAGNGYQANTSYSISEYPYLTFDFDIAKIEGDYAGAGFNPYYYGNGPVYDDFGNLSTTLKQETGGNTTIKLSAFKKYLPQEYYTWAHVTLIFKYHIMDDTEYIGGYAYVNGELVYTNHTLHTLSTARLASNYYFGTFRINNDGGTNTKNFTGYDNWQINYFNKAYTDEEVASYVYNENYKLPYGKTVARIGSVLYDSVPSAIAACKYGEVITLLADVEDVMRIEKPVTIDTNKYGEDGLPTGEKYQFSSTSTSLLSSTVDGVVMFKQVQNASVEIYWDDCPGIAANGVCTCDKQYLDENGEHIMSHLTPTAMLNSVPFYDGETPTFPIVNGISKEFIGWSYTQGGEVEELRAITPEDVNKGWIALYPVYRELQYSIEVIDVSGSSTFYLASEYDAAFSASAANSTIKLHTDVNIDVQIDLAKKNLTLDLNGFTLGHVKATITDYEATYDSSTGSYVKGAQMGEPVESGTAGYIFYSKASNFTFNITSSRPGGVLATVTVSADRWMCDGVPVKVDNVVTASGGGLFSLYPSNATYNIVSEKGYLTIYAGCLFYGEHGSNGAGLATTIDGANIYLIGNHGEGGNAIRGGGNHYFRNCTILGSGGNLHKNSSGTARNRDSNFFYENCDISNGTFYSAATTDTFTFTNCRLNVKFSGAFELYIGDGTYSVVDPTTFSTFKEDNSLEVLAVSESFTYNRLTGAQINLDPVTLLPNATPSVNETSGTYEYYYFNPLYGPTTVIWKDIDGNVISEVTASKNKPVVAPEIVVAVDGWRKVSNITWVDSEGNPSDLMLGDAEEYVFTAKLPEEADRQYSSHLTVAKLSMAYYSRFAYNIYVPKTDAVEVISIAGKAVDTVAFIDGEEYYVYTVHVDPIDALEDYTVSVEYAIDGQSFTAELTVSAYVYAMASVADTAHTAADKEASGALIRYIEQIYKYAAAAGTPMSDEAREKISAFYAEYTPADYVTEYPQNEIHYVDVAAIGGLIESMYFRVWNGTRVGFAVSLTDEAVALGYKVSIGGAQVEASLDGKLFYAEGVALYASLMNPSYSVSVVDAEGNVVMRDLDGDSVAEKEASTNYSMATYIVSMEDTESDVELVKALYALGKATIAVRNEYVNN